MSKVHLDLAGCIPKDRFDRVQLLRTYVTCLQIRVKRRRDLPKGLAHTFERHDVRVAAHAPEKALAHCSAGKTHPTHLKRRR
ncbi:hypothetical protein [Trinickia symbiotica]|uniref:hypothetical protein n=1 Tax=Trinickia symbiotica TaxID=863227 RepID=UPI00039DD54B|nr:hypothetical protein [Trinickia symbiotica]